MNKSKKKDPTFLGPDDGSVLCTALPWSPVSVIFLSSFHVFNVTSTIQSPCLNSRKLEKVHSISVAVDTQQIFLMHFSLATPHPPTNSFQPNSPGGRGSFCPSYEVMLSPGLTEQFSALWEPPACRPHTSAFPSSHLSANCMPNSCVHRPPFFSVRVYQTRTPNTLSCRPVLELYLV